MEQAQDGYRRFLEVQVEALQEQLYGLERDPEQVEYLKSILRVCQRLRHAREADEPESVHLLRNAVEKVTLRLGRSGAHVSQDVLDFYVDTFDLLEEAVRRWPAGLTFDRARYADRVRGLLDLEPAAPAAAESSAAVHPAAEPRPAEAPASFRGGEPVEVALPEEPEMEPQPAAAEPAMARDVPTWTDAPPTGGVQVLLARDVAETERSLFVEGDLAALLVERWRGAARAATAPAGAGAAAGGLAASYSSFEALRSGESATSQAVASAPAAEAQAALTRLRDVLDAFSVSLTDLDRASQRLLSHGAGSLGEGTLASLARRLELEKQKLTGVFDRAIESFRSGRG
jgi:chemotaxis protein histidine kinase CheA